MTGRGLRTLKVERNVARAPVFAPKAGTTLETAWAWSPVPFHGAGFAIVALAGVLTPADLLVFSHLCSLHLVAPSADRRVEMSLGDISRWLGHSAIGGEQRRTARACLERLLMAAFTSMLRTKGPTTDRWVEGWHLIERWQMPTRGYRTGSVWLSETIVSLLEAGSFVFLDSATMAAILHRSSLAVRLWVYLEAETLYPRRRKRYALFAAPPGAPTRTRKRAAISDLLRLADKQRRKTVLKIRRACEVIVELDPRYELSVAHAVEVGMWNLEATRRHQPVTGVNWATVPGDLGNVNRATWATDGGDLGNARGDRGRRGSRRNVRGNRASQATLAPAADVLSQTFSPDGCQQAIRTDRKPGTRGESVSNGDPRDAASVVIARDRSILADPDAPRWKRDAALAHLELLGVPSDTALDTGSDTGGRS